MESAPLKLVVVAAVKKLEMTATVLVTWIVALWTPVVNLPTVWKFAWNAVEFVSHHEAMTV